jgi:N-acetylneuraminate synthase
MGISIEIAGRKIGPGEPTFIIAEMSANHNQSFDDAVRIIHEAKECGADAIKLQTYTPDTLTIDSDSDYFRIKGTLWEGESLYSLYAKACTPWEWQPMLKKIAEEAGLIFFSTAFDRTAVDFLDELSVPVHKVASFELVDIPLIEYMAGKGKPLIMSTGMATYEEISEAVETARGAGARDIALLKCTSAYPAEPEDMNLKTIPDMADSFGVVVGLSDHTLGVSVPVASVALGASIIEKHFTLSRANVGPDSAFSLEPEEFKALVGAVRAAEKALGSVSYGTTGHEEASKVFRKSLFAVKDIKAGETITGENVRSIRPGYGLKPKRLKEILGKKAKSDIKKGTPISWEFLD